MFVLAAACAVFAVSTAAASAASTVTYNAAVDPLPGNLPSVGAEAYAFSEFGDEVTLASGTARKLNTVQVTMSSWGCQQGNWVNKDCVTSPHATFSVPITMNIYNATSTAPGITPVLAGSRIATVTKTFAIPYRPTANLQHCNGPDLGKWWQKASNTCFNGKAANISFNFKSLGLTLPSTVVIGISYDTSHYGYSPIGESPACFSTEAGCAYDSLNIALGPAVTVGSKPYPDTVFQNAAFGSEYCDATPLTGVFNLDSPTSACWSGYVPALQIKTH
jgi:hypothetical protein